MTALRLPRCGDLNQQDPRWPATVSPGCGNELHAIQYTNHKGKHSVCFMCPLCDSPDSTVVAAS